MILNEDELKHVGKKGMRWGIRNKNKSLKSSKSKSKEKIYKVDLKKSLKSSLSKERKEVITRLVAASVVAVGGMALSAYMGRQISNSRQDLLITAMSRAYKSG